MMLEEWFLDKQPSQRARDVLNYLHGFLSSFDGLRHHFEKVDGRERGVKINYRLNGYTLFAIRIRTRDAPVFLAAVRDPQKILRDRRMTDRGKMEFEEKGYRFFTFSETDEDVEFAKKQIAKVIEFHCSQQ